MTDELKKAIEAAKTDEEKKAVAEKFEDEIKNLSEEELDDVAVGAGYDSSIIYVCTKCSRLLTKFEIDFSSDIPVHTKCGTRVKCCDKSTTYLVAKPW